MQVSGTSLRESLIDVDIFYTAHQAQEKLHLFKLYLELLNLIFAT